MRAPKVLLYLLTKFQPPTRFLPAKSIQPGKGTEGFGAAVVIARFMKRCTYLELRFT